MIYINLNKLVLPPDWESRAQQLTRDLEALPPNNRADFIDSKRHLTWGAAEVLNALRAIAGNKCWYSEVPLEGADPNVDHFRPKGQVREVDANLQSIGTISQGYWWLAFNHWNFRLSSMHSNQRRVDTDTHGGKWDYFPVIGQRTPERTPCLAIIENILALDPCSASDVSLLWFDPDGKPSCAVRNRQPNTLDQQRVRTTIWLYHLDKREIQLKRGNHMRQIRIELDQANADYLLWNRDSATPDLRSKNSFDRRIAEIKSKLADNAEFAGAKRCAVQAAVADYEWIDEFVLFNL